MFMIPFGYVPGVRSGRFVQNLLLVIFKAGVSSSLKTEMGDSSKSSSYSNILNRSSIFIYYPDL